VGEKIQWVERHLASQCLLNLRLRFTRAVLLLGYDMSLLYVSKTSRTQRRLAVDPPRSRKTLIQHDTAVHGRSHFCGHMQ
jgi:hypothetical protein